MDRVPTESVSSQSSSYVITLTLQVAFVCLACAIFQRISSPLCPGRVLNNAVIPLFDRDKDQTIARRIIALCLNVFKIIVQTTTEERFKLFCS